MVTSLKHNDFAFEDDKRGFIVSQCIMGDENLPSLLQACVDSSRNVLGVCCVDLVTMLSGQGRPVRQDDVFKVKVISLYDNHYLDDVLQKRWSPLLIWIARDPWDRRLMRTLGPLSSSTSRRTTLTSTAVCGTTRDCS